MTSPWTQVIERRLISLSGTSPSDLRQKHNLDRIVWLDEISLPLQLCPQRPITSLSRRTRAIPPLPPPYYLAHKYKNTKHTNTQIQNTNYQLIMLYSRHPTCATPYNLAHKYTYTKHANTQIHKTHKLPAYHVALAPSLHCHPLIIFPTCSVYTFLFVSEH